MGGGPTDAGPESDAPRTRPAVDAGEPLPPPDGTCVRSSLGAEPPCADSANCPVAFMTEFVCEGWGRRLGFVVDDERSYIKLAFGSSNPFEQVVWQLLRGGEAMAEAARLRSPWLELAARHDRAPALFELGPESLTAFELDGSPEVGTAASFNGRIINAVYDREDTLRVLSRVTSPDGGTGHYELSPGSQILPIPDRVATEGALLLEDGSIGVVYRDRSMPPQIGYWSEATGIIAGPSLLDLSSDLTAVVSPTGELRVTYVANGGLQLLDPVTPGSETSFVAQSALPVNCEGFFTADFPDVCPAEVETEALGLRSAQQAPAFGSEGESWVVSLEADADYRCEWVTVSGCFESLPCDCAQQPAVDYEPLELVLRSASAPSMPVVVPLAAEAGAELKVAERSDGQFVVVVTSLERGPDRQRQTRLRYLEVETN